MAMFSLIVLSRTDSQSIHDMNLECINTFIKSANHIAVGYEVVLIESNKSANYDYKLPSLKIITPDAAFNFHKFLNIGISNSSGDYYVLSNNDVIFDENWLKEVLDIAKKNTLIKSFSPFDLKSNKLPLENINNKDYLIGYEIQKHLTGWCLVAHKSVFNVIKRLDERFKFYYADNDYAMQLQKYNIKHALVTKAKVHHLESGKSKNNNADKNPVVINKRVPDYVIKENWTWVLGNEKMEEGLIQFHDKWGGRKLIKIKLGVANVLSKLGLGVFNRLIIFNN